MAVRTLDIGIIGAGTAGAASAVLLARAGHRVALYEAVPEPSPVGAGIMLQPSGMGVLAQLGLLGEVVERGAEVSRLHCLTATGRTVLDLEYARFHPRAFGLGLHRGVLFQTLLGAARREPGVRVLCGVRIESLHQRGDKRVVEAAEGPVAAHDLVVVADGARSQLRDGLAQHRKVSLYPWGALWAVLPDPDRRFTGELLQVVRGTGEMAGFLPSGLGPVPAETPLVSLFWSVHAGRVDALREAGLGAFKRRVCALEPRAETILSAVQDMEQLLLARYYDVVLPRWHTAEGVVLLGDAAHATSPQLGQGANLALCDAAALALSLREEESLAAALARYSAERRAHLRYYQWATRFLTPFFQSDARVLGLLRDTFMGAACRLPFLASKMVRTMCGLERGLFLGRSMPLPALTSGAR